jgi:hypothetical protein
MKSTLLSFTITCFITFLFGHSVLAAGVTVMSHLEVTASIDGQVTGSISAEVVNVTGTDIHNVNLRMVNAGEISVDRGLLQFGKIPNGELRAMTRSFHAQQTYIDSPEPILWYLDYDDSDGVHRQLTIFDDGQ